MCHDVQEGTRSCMLAAGWPGSQYALWRDAPALLVRYNVVGRECSRSSRSPSAAALLVGRCGPPCTFPLSAGGLVGVFS